MAPSAARKASAKDYTAKLGIMITLLQKAVVSLAATFHADYVLASPSKRKQNNADMDLPILK